MELKFSNYVKHFLKKTKWFLLAFVVLAFLQGYLIFFGGLIGIIIVYFIKYLDSDLKIKKD